MFKDLRTSTKLVILCGVFMIAIGVTTYNLVREKLIAIEFARKELVGAKYLAVVGRFFATVLDGAPSDASFTSNSVSGREILKELSEAQINLGATFQIDAPVQALAASMQLWSTNVASDTAPAFALGVFSKARQLASRIADDSNPTLDPDLDSYYIQNLVTRKLPEFFQQLGELKSLTYKTPSKASPFEQTERLQFLAGQLRSISEDLRDDVAAAYRGNRDGALKHSIDSAFTALGSRTNTYLHDLNAGDVASTGVLAANGSYNRAVESAVGAFATAQLALVRLLEKRIGELLEKMRWSMFLTGALAALSIFMAAMTHWHVVRPLRRFENVASAVRDSKDYGLRVDYSGRDEIGRLVLCIQRHARGAGLGPRARAIETARACAQYAIDDHGGDDRFDRSRD